MTATAWPSATTGLLHNRNFRLLWIGQAASSFGSAMSLTVFPLFLIACGYSTWHIGALGSVVLLVGWLARVPAGYLADRFDQKRIMVVSDVARGASAILVAICALAGRMPLALALAVTIVSNVALETFRPALAKAIQTSVAPAQIATATAVTQARGYAVNIAAPFVAGVLLALGTALPFMVDALTFTLSLLCVVALRPAPRRHRPDERPIRFLPAIGEGWRYVTRDPFLRWASIYCAVLNLAYSALTYVVLLGIGREKQGAVAVGTTLTAAAVAGLCGALLGPWVSRRVPLRLIIATGPAISAAFLGGAWVSQSAWALGGGFVALCLMTPVLGVTFSAILAVCVPEEIYGRTVATTGFVTQVLQPLGPLAAGMLLAATSRHNTAAGLAALLSILAVVAFRTPRPARPASER